MKTNVLTLAITLTISVILAGSLLMPVLSNATTTERTFTNEGVFNYGKFVPDDDYTLSYDSTGIEVNGTPVSIPGVTPGTVSQRYSVIASDNVIVRFGSAADGYLAQIVGMRSGETTMSSPAPKTFTATISSDQISITWTNTSDVETTYVFDFTEMYAIVPSTDVAIMKVSTEAVYIKGDSDLYASGLTTVTHWSNMFHFEGTYEDGITITSPSLPDATFDNITWNVETVDGYIDLYKLTSIEFDIHNNDTTVHATYSYFAVPATVTAELSQHLAPGEIAILNALPVLIIVALVVMAAGALYLKRDD